ncbi:MAG: o-succinylbenzoate synthase [Bacteroidetes bacterium]|nr:o-succinylbenzoate synthase [Bacteroidota bacterium]
MFYTYHKHVLEYINPIKTSRGSMSNHEAYYILAFENRDVYDRLINSKEFIDIHDLIKHAIAIGEASPLKGLSIDFDTVETAISNHCHSLNERVEIDPETFKHFPSLSFAFQTIELEIKSKKKGQLYTSDFTEKNSPLEINGLVWMNEIDQMEQEAFYKIKAGFDTIKFKVGSHDFDEECRLLERIRKQYSAWKLTIRLDANGAFPADDALLMMKELSRFEIHSIEQPIKTKQYDLLEKLCRESKIPIALDEELIGIDVHQQGHILLKNIHPQYIIIKPTLLGSFDTCDAWIDICKKHQIGWWATSALESNIGLNAIAQWVATKNNSLPQGLGTGLLYKNNIPSTMRIADGKLFHH